MDKVPVCAKCGTPLIATAKFCYICGTPVDGKPQTNKLSENIPTPQSLATTGSSSFPSRLLLKYNNVTIASILTKDIPSSGYIIGRSGEGSTPNLDLVATCSTEQAQFISRKHAAINRTGYDGLTITDLGSANGTLKNGVQLGRNVPYVLYDNDKLSFGKVVIEVYSAP